MPHPEKADRDADSHIHKVPRRLPASASPIGEIQLSLLLAQDAAPTPGCLPDVLGDSFLCRKNPVFYAVRQATLRSGYRFDPGPSPLWNDYQICPLLCLPAIHAERAIPYSANKDLLRRLAAVSPRQSLGSAFFISSYKANYVFHESCHAIARQVLASSPEFVESLSDTPEAHFVWNSVLEEAFANVVERISVVNASSLAHRVFFLLNSYAPDATDETSIVAEGLSRFGISTTFQTLFLSFVAANLQVRQAEESFEKIRHLTQTGSHPALAGYGDKLYLEFREQTALSYYGLRGATVEFARLSVMPLFDASTQVEALLQIADRLQAIVWPVVDPVGAAN